MQTENLKAELLTLDKDELIHQFIILSQQYTELQRQNKELESDFKQLSVICFKMLSKLGIISPAGEIETNISKVVGSLAKIAAKSMLPASNIVNDFAFMQPLEEIWKRKNAFILDAVNNSK